MRLGDWAKWGAIEIDRVPNDPNGDHDLMIDGALVDHKHANVHSGYNDLFSISLHNENVVQQFIRYSILELPPIEYLNFRFKCGGTPVTAMFFSTRNDNSPRPHSYTMTFEAEPDLSNWTKPYSFAEYCDQLSRHIQALKVGAQFRTAQDENKLLQVSSFWIEFPLSAPALPLKNEINRRAETLRMLHEEIESVLLPGSSSNSVAVAFNFPDQVKVPCEQYLIYFVEFLRDLGVEATSDLRHEAGRVLFTVTPKDPLEALDNIRVALEIYLRLPSSPIDENAVDDDMTGQKLLANIHHLTGQLALARAILEAKNATIQAQQLAIDKNALSADVIIESVVDIAPVVRKDDREVLLGGMVAVTKYQGKGFEINLPEVFRWLRGLFGKSTS